MIGATLRRSLLAPAFVLALAGVSRAQSFAVEVTADTLNVRAWAMGTVLGQVHQGDRFAASGQQGGWLQIDWQGRSAFVSASYVRRVNADLVKITTDVNVRVGQDQSHSRIGVAKTGQTYVRLGSGAGWNLIQFDGRRGWVVAWATNNRTASAATPPPASPAVPSTGTRVRATAEEMEILARIIKGEAAQCSFEGKVAVAAVVLNRVKAPGFPSTIRGVAHQPWQFSCYNADVRNRLYWGPIPQSCWDAARAALNGQDPSLGATFYFNPYLVLPSWSRTMRRTVRIGTNALDTHDFYKPR